MSPDVNAYDLVLIDDDDLIHHLWSFAARAAGKRLLLAFTIAEVLARSSELSPEVPIFIDSNLANGVRGEDASLELYLAGFWNLSITTGYDPESIEPHFWIRQIIEKSPPWLAAVSGW